MVYYSDLHFSVKDACGLSDLRFGFDFDLLTLLHWVVFALAHFIILHVAFLFCFYGIC